jgi:L-lactate utilization protein LutC
MWNTVATDQVIDQTKTQLEANGMTVIVVKSGAEAKEKALELIPAGAEVMNMTSVTLDEIGVSQAITESGKFNSVKSKLMQLDRATQGAEMQKLGSAPEWSVGSVHALTQDGHALIASMTGSQLPGYSYGSSHVLWVVGAQKIVPTLKEAMARLEEYVLPLESERAHKAYGVPGSSINKMLIVNKEFPGRITIIIVKEKLGY